MKKICAIGMLCGFMISYNLLPMEEMQTVKKRETRFGIECNQPSANITVKINHKQIKDGNIVVLKYDNTKITKEIYTKYNTFVKQGTEKISQNEQIYALKRIAFFVKGTKRELFEFPKDKTELTHQIGSLTLKSSHREGESVSIYCPILIHQINDVPYYLYIEHISREKKKLLQVYKQDSTTNRFAYISSFPTDATKCKHISDTTVALYGEYKIDGYQLYDYLENALLKAPNITGSCEHVATDGSLFIFAAINRYQKLHNTTDAYIHVYNIGSLQTVAQLVGPTKKILALKYYQKKLAALALDNKLHIYCTQTYKNVATLDVPAEMLRNDKKSSWAPDNEINAHIRWINDNTLAIVVNTGYYKEFTFKT